MHLRVGIDTGGTFTDLVIYDDDTGRLVFHKVPSTPGDPSRAIVDGLRQALHRGGWRPGDVRVVIHGTTVATNSVLQRRGAKTALLVTEGFRDVLHIQRQDRPKLYDLRARRALPLVPRRLRLEVPERILADGSVLRELDEPAVARHAALLTAEGVESVAVCFLHSYRNPAHERRAGELLGELLPGVRVTLSHEIAPEYKEYERMSTAVVSAFVQPVLGGYLESVRERLRGAGVSPELYVMTSAGGITTAAGAARRCAETILSGPAAGALGGAVLARRQGFRSVMTADMGGTSFDVALATDGQPALARETEVAGLALKLPMLDIHTIGAGGGSIAWIDPGGALRVGPQSAGAEPGPAAYGKGGTDPTVTDANLVLGRLASDSLLGGAVWLDLKAAREAIGQRIATPLKLSIEAAAEGIIEVVNATMSRAIREVAARRGADLRDFVLMPFGGAGPLHAGELARELGIGRLLIPIGPGVTSALGLLLADFRQDHVHTVLASLEAMSGDDLDKLFRALEAQAERGLRDVSLESATLAEPRPAPHGARFLELRYRGQGYELEIPADSSQTAASIMDQLRERFHAEHARLYGFRRDEQPIECVNLRVVAVQPLAPVRLPHAASEGASSKRRTVATPKRRPVYAGGHWLDAAVIPRGELSPADEIEGPAIIEQDDSTTWLLPGQRAGVDSDFNLQVQVIEQPENPSA